MGQSSNTTYRSSYTRFRIYQLNSLLVSVDSMSMLPTLTARNSRTALGGNTSSRPPLLPCTTARSQSSGSCLLGAYRIGTHRSSSALLMVPWLSLS